MHPDAAAAPPGASPCRIDAAAGPWPLHDSAASRRAEQAAQAHHAPGELMARAGLAVARLALAMAPHGGQIQVWAGPGNNGGDGLVAAHHLHRAGQSVQVALIGDPQRLPADAARALQRAQDAGVPIASVWASGPSRGLSIDALLGLGARRAPAGAIADAIRAMQRRGAPVLAVDLPSGLDPDTGTAFGESVVRAEATLSLLTLKPGCFTHQGRDLAAEVWLDTLGVDAGEPTAWLSGAPGLDARPHASHKGRFGDVAVVGGAPGMVGAAWLCARAALAAGAGRVYCSPLDPHTPLTDPAWAELMGRHDWWRSPPPVLRDTTVACGCGGGDAVREALPPLLSGVQRLVLDADALNAIAVDATLQRLLQARAARGHATLLTPHPLEAARLSGLEARAVQGDRLAAADALCRRFGCAVLLKGSGTVVASPGLAPRINPTGNAALATAGAGDVLAGWAAGLWAQTPDAHPGRIAIDAAWQHGRVADRWGPARRGAPLTAGALIDRLAQRDFG